MANLLSRSILKKRVRGLYSISGRSASQWLTVCPAQPLTAQVADSLKGQLKHGTTIGALLVDDGKRAVAFSDGKVSMGHEPVHLGYRKMMAVDSHTVLLFSGSPSLAVQYGRAVRNWIGYRQDTTNGPMTARAKELAIEGILLRGISLLGAGILLAPIMVTYDHAKGRVRLFNFGPEGSMTEHDRFTTSGSGMSVRHRIDERLQERDRSGAGSLTLPEGIAMARDFIANIGKVDSMSGGKLSMDIVGPDGVVTMEE
jgi:20S proteasome alpha/beta subunit